MPRGEPGPWQKELDDFVRAFCGAFLFGIPLLFTMEMWWIGTYAHSGKLLALLALAFVANLGLAYFAGFKHESTFGSSIDQAIDALAVGVVGSVVVLLALNRIDLADPLDSIVGKVAVQTVPLSIGASVANVVFAYGKGRLGEGETQNGGPGRGGVWHTTLNDVGATMAGGMFVGFAIAPTDEIPMLAAALTPLHLLALVGLSLVLTYAIVFEAGFDPQQGRPKEEGLFRSPLSETAMAYVVSLAVALVALYLFNRVDLGDPLAYVVSQTLVLGLVTSIGGAAGRLII